MRLTNLILGAFLAATNTQAADPQGVQAPAVPPKVGAITSHGCYSSVGNLTRLDGTDKAKVSSGYCNGLCTENKFGVTGLQGPDCYCGNAYPPKDDLVNDSQCNAPCPAYPPEACGGTSGQYSIWDTGLNWNVPNYDPATASSTTGPSSTNKSGATTTGAATDKPEKGGTNVAGIAAGVVVGVAAAAAIVGGIIFFMKRKRSAEMEEESRRNAAVNAFISGSQPPSSHGSLSMADSRLDPVMAHRRMSDGSIADNEDYSRRILRVTNA